VQPVATSKDKTDQPASLVISSWQKIIVLRLWHVHCPSLLKQINMIRKLKSGKYRLYSKKKNPKTNKRRNLGTFDSLGAAQKHERDVQYFKRH